MTARSTILMALLVFGRLSFTPPESSAEPKGPDSALRAAVVPGANFLAHFDVAAIRSSAFMEALAGEGESQLLPTGVGKMASWLARLESAGMPPGNIREVFVTGDSDSIHFDASRSTDRVRGTPALMAVSVAKAIEPEDLRRFLTALWSENRTVEPPQTGDGGVVELRSTKPGEPNIYGALSRARTTVFLTTERDTLDGALARERSGRYEDLSGAIERVDAGLSPDLDARVVFLTPRLLRDRLLSPHERPAGRPPTMPERILKPFESLQALAVTADFADDARITILGDLADAESVGAAESMLSTLILPNLERLLAARLGTALHLEQSVTVASVGSTLQLGLDLTADDLKALRESSGHPPAVSPQRE